MKKRVFLWSAVSALIVAGVFTFFGCGTLRLAKEQLEETKLWVLTEKTVHDGMNAQLDLVVEQFVQKHPGTAIQIEMIPTEKEERDGYIKALRKKIAGGEGPDVYLLPTARVLTLEEPKKYTYVGVEPVFPDVTAAMYQGVFQDLSDWYDADRALEKKTLLPEVMDAGVIGGKRYVLPLRYDAPVLYVWEDAFKTYGVDSLALSGGIQKWMEYAVEKKNAIVAQGAEFVSMKAFSRAVDYEQGCVTLVPQVLEQYLSLVQQVQTLVGKEVSHRSAATLSGYVRGLWKPIPIQAGRLSNALLYRAIADAEQKKLEIYPLRTVEGDYQAEITYFAAVGANSKSPSMAYEFVRRFLLQEAQWEQLRPEPEHAALIEKGLPVRIQDGVAPLWKCWNRLADQLIIGRNGEHFERLEKIRSQNLTELSILNEKFDCVAFPLPQIPSFHNILQVLNDYENGNKARDIDLSYYAQKILNELTEKIL